MTSRLRVADAVSTSRNSQSWCAVKFRVPPLVAPCGSSGNSREKSAVLRFPPVITIPRYTTVTYNTGPRMLIQLLATWIPALLIALSRS